MGPAQKSEILVPSAERIRRIQIRMRNLSVALMGIIITAWLVYLLVPVPISLKQVLVFTLFAIVGLIWTIVRGILVVEGAFLSLDGQGVSVGTSQFSSKKVVPWKAVRSVEFPIPKANGMWIRSDRDAIKINPELFDDRGFLIEFVARCVPDGIEHIDGRRFGISPSLDGKAFSSAYSQQGKKFKALDV